MLKCPAKDVINGYPLKIEISQFEVKESEINEEFIIHLLTTLDWNGVLLSAEAVGLNGLPTQLNEDIIKDFRFLNAIHHLLFDIHIIDGKLICPESGRIFYIRDGLLNLTLPEDQV